MFKQSNLEGIQIWRLRLAVISVWNREMWPRSDKLKDFNTQIFQKIWYSRESQVVNNEIKNSSVATASMREFLSVQWLLSKRELPLEVGHCWIVVFRQARLLKAYLVISLSTAQFFRWLPHISLFGLNYLLNHCLRVLNRSIYLKDVYKKAVQTDFVKLG